MYHYIGLFLCLGYKGLSYTFTVSATDRNLHAEVALSNGQATLTRGHHVFRIHQHTAMRTNERGQFLRPIRYGATRRVAFRGRVY